MKKVVVTEEFFGKKDEVEVDGVKFQKLDGNTRQATKTDVRVVAPKAMPPLILNVRYGAIFSVEDGNAIVLNNLALSVSQNAFRAPLSRKDEIKTIKRVVKILKDISDDNMSPHTVQHLLSVIVHDIFDLFASYNVLVNFSGPYDYLPKRRF